MTRESADLASISKKIERFIARYVLASDAKGLVMGLSGGLDSSVVLKLAVNALGAAKVHGLIMPSSVTPDQDVGDATSLAKDLGVRYEVIKVDPIVRSFVVSLPESERAQGNLTARIRMCILYYYAALSGYLVAGTSDKSEKMIGFYTKYGDGAADILPIADLYKTQVRKLASFLGVPVSIIEKKSSPRLWKDHVAEEEIGMSYEKLDPILQLLAKSRSLTKGTARKHGVSFNDFQKVKDMVDKAAHKRRPVPYPKL